MGLKKEAEMPDEIEGAEAAAQLEKDTVTALAAGMSKLSSADEKPAPKTKAPKAKVEKPAPAAEPEDDDDDADPISDEVDDEATGEDDDGEFSQKQLDAIAAAGLDVEDLPRDPAKRAEKVARLVKMRSEHDRMASAYGKLLAAQKGKGADADDTDGADAAAADSGDSEDDSDPDALDESKFHEIDQDDLDDYDNALKKSRANEKHLLARVTKLEEALKTKSTTERDTELDAAFNGLEPEVFGEVFGTGPRSLLKDEDAAEARDRIVRLASKRRKNMLDAGTPITWADAVERELRAEYPELVDQQKRVRERAATARRKNGSPETYGNKKKAPAGGRSAEDEAIKDLAAGLSRIR